MSSRRNRTWTCISATVKAGRRQARPDRRYNVMSDIFWECVSILALRVTSYAVSGSGLLRNAYHGQRLKVSSVAPCAARHAGLGLLILNEMIGYDRSFPDRI